MADNYLEKRMQDYAGGRLGKSRVPSHSGLRCIKIPQTAVFFVDATPCDLLPLKALVEIGYKVSFTAPEDGQNLAQSTGARFYPIEFEAIAADLAKRGEKLHAIIRPEGLAVPLSAEKTVELTEKEPAARALEALYKCY